MRFPHPMYSGVRVLAVNTGSSSVKLRVLDGDDRLAWSADLGPLDEAELAGALTSAGAVDVVGHRVVHGGERFRAGVVVDDAVEAELDALAPLAPLHNPPAVAAVRAARRALAVPHVACFDTAFHATLPDEAAVYAVPAEWRERWGVHRYGFHGLSHAYAARRAAALLGRPVEDLRLVTCHLGAGASLCAVAGGRSVDTTMGFTPLDGLVMATRSGSVDPGALLWVQRRAGLRPDELEDALEHHSGLLGLSGLSADPRELFAAADAGHAGAALALGAYLHRLCGQVAAMATAAGGLDAVVFTGGVGEHDARMRAEAVARLAWLGPAVDPERNGAAPGDAVVSPEGHRPAVCVVAAREDLEIAAECRRALG
ncbi:MAG TPA: acetate/propionate family kinase [Acidimicrobiales bacterium]|nr:acetate/propionate family kinase [Acidimicrobiales bacterium]